MLMCLTLTLDLPLGLLLLCLLLPHLVLLHSSLFQLVDVLFNCKALFGSIRCELLSLMLLKLFRRHSFLRSLSKKLLLHLAHLFWWRPSGLRHAGRENATRAKSHSSTDESESESESREQRSGIRNRSRRIVEISSLYSKTADVERQVETAKKNKCPRERI